MEWREDGGVGVRDEWRIQFDNTKKRREKVKATVSTIAIVTDEQRNWHRPHWMCHRSHLNTHRISLLFFPPNKQQNDRSNGNCNLSSSQFSACHFIAVTYVVCSYFAHTHSFLSFKLVCKAVWIPWCVKICLFVFSTKKYRNSSAMTFLLFLVNAQNKRTAAKFSWRAIINSKFRCSSHRWIRLFAFYNFIFVVPRQYEWWHRRGIVIYAIVCSIALVFPFRLVISISLSLSSCHEQ